MYILYIYIIWFFPNFSKSGRQILTKFGGSQEDPRGRLWTKLGENLTRKFFLMGPKVWPKIDPNFWSPISLEGVQIFARSLHRWLGDAAPYKFGLSENFRTGTLKGSKLRGVIFKIWFFPIFQNSVDGFSPNLEEHKRAPGWIVVQNFGHFQITEFF